MRKMKYKDFSFDVFTLTDENPGVDGFLCVNNAPEEICLINGGLFLHKGEIEAAIDEIIKRK